MTKSQLEQNLNEILERFKNELPEINPYDNSPATRSELLEANKQVFYALNDFKNQILQYIGD